METSPPFDDDDKGVPMNTSPPTVDRCWQRSRRSTVGCEVIIGTPLSSSSNGGEVFIGTPVPSAHTQANSSFHSMLKFRSCFIFLFLWKLPFSMKIEISTKLLVSSSNILVSGENTFGPISPVPPFHRGRYLLSSVPPGPISPSQELPGPI